MLSCLSVLLAFYFSSFLFAYLFLSMLFMSLVYVFNVSEVMNMKIFYFLLLPYFLINHLSWVYVRKKLPLYNSLNENIYFGRMPTKNEYEKLKNLGIKVFINLANDMKFNTYYQANFTANLMDMSIQEPKKIR